MIPSKETKEKNVIQCVQKTSTGSQRDVGILGLN